MSGNDHGIGERGIYNQLQLHRGSVAVCVAALYAVPGGDQNQSPGPNRRRSDLPGYCPHRSEGRKREWHYHRIDDTLQTLIRRHYFHLMNLSREGKGRERRRGGRDQIARARKEKQQQGVCTKLGGSSLPTWVIFCYYSSAQTPIYRLTPTRSLETQPPFISHVPKVGENRNRCDCGAFLASPPAARTSRH
jgi:hypothetical protein